MEPLLDPQNNRLTVYPIKFREIWNWYKKMQAANWTAEEIDFSNDYGKTTNTSLLRYNQADTKINFYPTSSDITLFNGETVSNTLILDNFFLKS